jgi:hypothetical protein
MSRTRVPLFVSHVRLRRRKSLPRAAGRWALDSGGFPELARHGRWTVTPVEYAAAVRRYRDEIGGLDFAAPQDWMCEPDMLARTGLTQERRTVENLLELRAPDLPWAPVVQGWTLRAHLRCVELYAAAGVDLTAEPRVGIGSVCRRTSPVSVAFIVASLHGAGLRNLHGFGIKTSALALCAEQPASADSMAWSFAARAGSERCPDGRRDCRNCLHFATEWGADAATAAGWSARTGSATADERAAIDQRDRQHDVRAAALADRAESIRPDDSR